MRRKPLLLVFVLLVVLAVPSTALAKTGSRLSMALSARAERYDQTPMVNATLKSSSGRALAGQPVSLYREGVKVATKKTSSAGKVSFQAVLPDEDDFAAWQVRYAGNASYFDAWSPSRSTYFDWAFNGWAEYVAQANNAYAFEASSVNLNAGRTYLMMSEKSVAWMVYLAGSNQPLVEGNLNETFVFSPPATAAYDIVLVALDRPSSDFLWLGIY